MVPVFLSGYISLAFALPSQRPKLQRIAIELLKSFVRSVEVAGAIKVVFTDRELAPFNAVEKALPAAYRQHYR